VAPTPNALESAIELYELGEASSAVGICLRILECEPDADALRLLGLISLDTGNAQAAVEYMSRAVAISPHVAELHCILGSAYRELDQLLDAAACYRRASQLNPAYAESHNNRGACLFDHGLTDEAIACYEQALHVDPRLAAAYYNLGNARQSQGEFDKAIDCYHQALQIDPEYVAAYTNLGAALFHQKRFEEAVVSYSKALELEAQNPEALNNLGAVFHEQQQYDSAIESYQRALRYHPDYADAHVNMGDALWKKGLLEEAAEAYGKAQALEPGCNEVQARLGIVLKELGRFGDAEKCYRAILQQTPDAPEVHNNLGTILQSQGQFEEAVSCYEKALELSPDYTAAHNNRGAALREQGRHDAAVESYQRAVQLGPQCVEAHVGLANTLSDLRRLEEAARAYDRAIELRPDNAEARFARSLALLRSGDFEQGWRELEWRWQTSQLKQRDLPIPRWRGAAIVGKRILIHAEQGLGDTIQFVRYLPLVKQRGGEVVFACRDLLLPLLGGVEGADQIVALGEEVPPCDLHAPLHSLPYIFDTALETIPQSIPYVSVDEQLFETWKGRLDQLPEKKIGICWQGNRNHRRDRFRSIPKQHFENLTGLDGITVISLQKGAEPIGDGVIDWLDEIDRDSGPFMDTAAIIENLDLVISSDTSVAHLAGALGRPVWLALDYAADWRWLLDRSDSPWYPTMRLFRQTSFGDWDGVMCRIREALELDL
jgi:tetratricopeptide (TPR) repeat protein